jgi:hypothetical protein
MMLNGSSWPRLRRIFRNDPQSEFDDELRFHLEQRVRDYVARGMVRGSGTSPLACLRRAVSVDGPRTEQEFVMQRTFFSELATPLGAVTLVSDGARLTSIMLLPAADVVPTAGSTRKRLALRFARSALAKISCFSALVQRTGKPVGYRRSRPFA